MRGTVARSCLAAMFVTGMLSLLSGATAQVAGPGNAGPAVAPPELPTPRAPTAFFRELLAMNDNERRTALETRSPQQQRLIIEKVGEYERMSPEERELRLKVTELRWHLMPLLRMPPASRQPRLEALEPEDRQLIEERLKQWDRLSSEARQQLLDHETTILYLLRLEGGSLEQREMLLREFPPARRQRLEEELSRWRALPAEQRQRMHNQFNQFFELTEREQEKTLNTLSEPERLQMERTLQRFQQLPPEQRRRSLESFRRFASLSAAERDQFLQSAQRWEAMSPSERQAWRELVNRLPALPPLPPGFGTPPLPPGAGSPPVPPRVQGLPDPTR